MARKLLFFLPFLLALFACDREEECFECKVVQVAYTQEFGDSVAVYYRNEREIGRCLPSKASRDKKEKEMKERAKEQREYLEAYADPDYEGHYTGKKSIDSEEDLFSMLDKKEPVYPFLIRVIECEHFSRIDRD